MRVVYQDADDVVDVRRVVTRRDRSQRSSAQRIDFAKLDAAPLRKYRRHYKLEVRMALTLVLDPTIRISCSIGFDKARQPGYIH